MSSTNKNGPWRALEELARRVPWFDAGFVLIVICLWWAAITHLEDLDGPIAILLLILLAGVTVYLASIMKQRFELVNRNSSSPVDSTTLDRIATEPPSQREYEEVIQAVIDSEDGDES